MPFDLTGSAPSDREARRIRRLWLLPPLLLSAAIAASVLAYPHLPAEMPTHWGFRGEPTNLMPRAFAAAAMPALMVWIGFLTWALMWSSSQTREARDLPAWLSPAVTAGVLATMLILHLALLLVGLGWGVSVPVISNIVVGLVFLLLGRLTQDMPPNPVFGVRTPRTLACPDAWGRANRVGGRWMMGAGVVTMGAAALPGGWRIGVMLGSVAVACLAGVLAARDGA